MKRKVLSVVLSLCMVLALIPAFTIENVTAAGSSTSVSTLSALQTALADSSVEEIIVTSKIALTNGTVLSGNGKTIIVRASATGVNEQGIVQSGSAYNVFTVASGVTAKIYDMLIKGGSETALVNNGTLYLDNVTISNSGSDSHGGGALNNTGTLVMVNSSIIRNVAKYGGGFLNTGTLIMDNCSLSENRSINGWGGGAGENQGKAYLNNCTIANNTSAEIGGGINNCKGGYLYLMNCTFTGNVTTGNDTNFGGAIGNSKDGNTGKAGTVKAVNCIFAYNYQIDGSTITPCDIGMYNGATGIEIYNSIVGTTSGGTPTLTNCTNDTEDLFAKTVMGGVLYEDGTESTVEFEKPAVIRNVSDELYTPLNGSYDGTVEGVPTYFDYSDLSNIRMYFTDDSTGTENTTFFAGSLVKATDLPVEGALDDTARSSSLVGSSNALPAGAVIYTIKVLKADNGMVLGGTIYGDSYVVFADGQSVFADEYVTVTLTAEAESGYYFSEWQYEDGTPINQNNPYQFVVNEDVVLKAVFTTTAPTYTVNYHANGGTGTMASQSFSPANRTQNLNANTFTNNDGSSFLGWALVFCGEVKYVDAQSYTAVGGADLYARWGFFINYNANGGRNAPEQQIKEADKNITLSPLAPTRENYVFKGWSTSSTATAADFQPGTVYTENTALDLYAVWQEVKTPAFINGSENPDYAVKDTAYSYTFETEQGAIFTSTDLPSWLTLSKHGVLTGTPTQTGTYTFNVTITSKIDTSLATTQQVTVTVYDYCDYAVLSNTVNNNTVTSADENLYTAETWAAYSEALANAESLLSDAENGNKLVAVAGENNQAVIDNANTALNNAIAALAFKDADYTALNNAITAAQAVDMTAVYPNADKTAFETALANAIACDDNLDITNQSAIDALTDALNEAMDKLGYYCDYSALENTVTGNPVDGKPQAKYPADLWQDYETALDNANALLNGEKQLDDADGNNQKAVDDAKTALDNAITALQANAYNEIKVYDKDGALTDTVYLADTTGALLNTSVTAPTVEGYEFLGWGDKDGNLFFDDDAINSDTSIYAYYELTLITPKDTSAIVVDHENKTVSGVSGKTNTVAEIKAELENDEILVIIKNYQSVLLTGDDKVGTGATITLVSKKDPTHIYEVATVILMGDVNGDGEVNDIDFAKLFGILFGTEADFTADEALFRIAGDIVADGVIDGFDMAAVDRIMYFIAH